MSTEIEAPATFLSADGEAVQGEPWFWIAYYDDGTHLPQFDVRDGRFHRFSEIEVERLAVFALQEADSAGPLKVFLRTYRSREWPRRFELPITEGMRPIHFYRNQRLNVGTPDEARVRLYCFGYQRTVGGRNFKTILEVHPTGTVRMVEE